MSSKPLFVYLDHVADIRFIAYGDTLENVFENAAKAMFSVIADIENIEPRVSFPAEIEADSLENLMVMFLSELLFLFDAEEVLFGSIVVKEIKTNSTNNTNSDKKYTITAVAAGEPIDNKKQNFKTEVKAVTYNGIRVDETSDGFEAEVVLDL
jgi:SHS2 domain-containing protein